MTKVTKLDRFLKRHVTKTLGTHINLDMGTYMLIDEDEDINDFYKVYIEHVFQKNKEAYLIEKQLNEGPILLDIDFKYNTDVISKQHNRSHIKKLVKIILDGINEIMYIEQNIPIDFYFFEKKNVNRLEKITKDGIHLMINLKMNIANKLTLRKYILNKIPEIWNDLPLLNTWNDVFDEYMFKGLTSWQLYGSRKPKNEPYELKYIFSCFYTEDNEWKINQEEFNYEWIIHNFKELTARNCTLVDFLSK